jgi:hypothetical protein
MYPRGTSKSTGYCSYVEVSENQRDSGAKKHENRARNVAKLEKRNWKREAIGGTVEGQR